MTDPSGEGVPMSKSRAKRIAIQRGDPRSDDLSGKSGPQVSGEVVTATERVHGFGLDPDCGPCERCLETEEREDEAWYAAREASERREAAKAWGDNRELVAVRADQLAALRSWWRSPASQPARHHLHGDVVSAIDSITWSAKPLEQIGRGQDSPREEGVWLWAGVDLEHGEPIYRLEGP